MVQLPRMRTLDACFNAIKEMDPNSAVSKYYIRQLALSGQISCKMCGAKRLINLDALIDFLSSSD